MSSFSAYNASRTPVLDGQHENAAHGELPLNANEAHRLANLIIDGRAPLRTPILDVQLSLASSEFAKHTGRTLEEVYEKNARDTYFEAEEAVAWGLADRIITSI